MTKILTPEGSEAGTRIQFELYVPELKSNEKKSSCDTLMSRSLLQAENAKPGKRGHAHLRTADAVPTPDSSSVAPD